MILKFKKLFGWKKKQIFKLSKEFIGNSYFTMSMEKLWNIITKPKKDN